ncbi:hypothetical protein CKO23_00205 [Thiocystis violacea]|nr:hypothetical protein [Thiocystis violacea]
MRPWILHLALAALFGSTALAEDIPSASDACAKGLTETTPSTEFALLEDGAVVRHERTTLEWKRCAEGQTWDADARGCQGRPNAIPWAKAIKLAKGAGGEWRLPTGEELLTIIEKCHYSPAINPQVFPNTKGVLFWSSSSDTGGLDRAWAVSFFGGQYYRAGKTQNGRVRLVRGTLKSEPKP